MRALFPKESPMLGFSFSLVVSGGAERDEASIFVDGRWVWTGLYGSRWEGGRAWTGLWKEGGC